MDKTRSLLTTCTNIKGFAVFGTFCLCISAWYD